MTESVQELLDQAVACHQKGLLVEAEDFYRRYLGHHPESADALYLLGTAMMQQGHFDESIQIFRNVLISNPEAPDVHNNLGIAYQSKGQWENAARSFQNAIKAKPDYAQAYHNLGSLMEGRGLLADAEKCFRQALEIQKNDPDTLLRLANVVKNQQRWEEAETHYRTLSLMDPTSDEVLVNLGFVLVRQEQLDGALEIYQRILKLKPDYAEIHNNLSFVYERLGRLEEAVAAAKQALQLNPKYAQGCINLGTALRSQHRLDDACDQFQQALKLVPGLPLAEFNYGTTRLLQGRFGEGWAGYERRAETLLTPPRTFEQPRWDGSPIPGQRLLIFSDQGYGDSLQFSRFLKLAKERSQATLIFECRPATREIFDDLSDVDEVIIDEETDDEASDVEFDQYLPLASLMRLFDVTIDNLPGETPYLQSNRPLPEYIKNMLAELPSGEPKVGLVWRGNPEQARDLLRSCELNVFSPILHEPGVTFVSLQHGLADDDPVRATMQSQNVHDIGSHLQNFAETAAVAGELDLLITVDTAAAHLAGGLGLPVWTLLSYTPDWRWLLDRNDCPWYPSMRLFRQSSWGHWDDVIHRVQTELQIWKTQHRENAGGTR